MARWTGRAEGNRRPRIRWLALRRRTYFWERTARRFVYQNAKGNQARLQRRIGLVSAVRCRSLGGLRVGYGVLLRSIPEFSCFMVFTAQAMRGVLWKMPKW